jgi:ubiquinone/menaquinone biosynthesis C-methylase UbiE
MPADPSRRRLFGRYYARVSPAMDAGGLAGYRQRLLAGLAGQVIEVGAGNGLNFPHYPATVTRVLAVEPNPVLREVAGRNAGNAPVPVTVCDGHAERLPAADGVFDAAVTSLVLCSVADQQAVLREIRRVLRPGGQLRFLEHVQAKTPGLRRLQRLADATLWPLLAGGCHTGRDTVTAIAAAGFTVGQVEEFRFPDLRLSLVPATPHVRGEAVSGAATDRRDPPAP